MMMTPPGLTRGAIERKAAAQSLVWCSTPFEITTSKLCGVNGGRNRFIWTKWALLMEKRSRKDLASFSEFRQRSAPTTVRPKPMPRKLLNWPVPQPASKMLASWEICSSSRREHAVARLAPQAVAAVESIVVRERGLLVECLHDVSDVRLAGG